MQMYPHGLTLLHLKGQGHLHLGLLQYIGHLLEEEEKELDLLAESDETCCAYAASSGPN